MSYPLHDSLLSPHGVPVPHPEAARIWRELALGKWQVLAAVDSDGTRYVALAPLAKVATPWEVLRYRARQVLTLATRGMSRKVIAAELGVTSTTVTETLRGARIRLGFSCLADLLRAYEANAH